MKESLLRTVVPIVYALLLKSGMGSWLGLDNQFLLNLAAAIAAGAVYLGLRLVEQYVPQLGWLLGYASPPKYEKKPPNPKVDRGENGFADPFIAALMLSLMSAIFVTPWNWIAAIVIMLLSVGVALSVHLLDRKRHSLTT